MATFTGGFKITPGNSPGNPLSVTPAPVVYVPPVLEGNLSLTLSNPNIYSTAVTDRFGFAVGISNSYTVVGATFEKSADGSQVGAAYIFDTTTGNLLHSIANPTEVGTGANDYFGFRVAASDTYSVISAQFEDDGGRVYVYNNVTGNLEYSIINPNVSGTKSGDEFNKVAISSSYIIVGAQQEDDGADQSGTAYIFNASNGSLLHTLDNPDTTAFQDRFGSDVDITDNYAIVGAENDAGNGGTAYIFDTVTGNLVHTLANPNAASTISGDDFGYSVGISDSYAIVGAPLEDANGTSSGTVYIFETASGNLLHTISNPVTGSGQFGYSVGITDNYAIVGAWNNAGGGNAYLYENESGNLVQSLSIPTSTSGDRYGWSVDICDEAFIVGAPFNSNDTTESGEAYIYR